MTAGSALLLRGYRAALRLPHATLRLPRAASGRIAAGRSAVDPLGPRRVWLGRRAGHGTLLGGTVPLSGWILLRRAAHVSPDPRSPIHDVTLPYPMVTL